MTGADRVAALSQAEHVLRSNQQAWPADIVAEIAAELRAPIQENGSTGA